MKILEGKTPAERNKIIAAFVLGFLAIVFLSWTFIFSGSSRPNVGKTNSNSNTKPSPSPNETIAAVPVDDNYGLGILPDNPFAVFAGDDPNRNIFALYDPSQNPAPQPIVKPTEIIMPPQPIPSPVPTPPIFVAYANPASVYARTGDFTLEVGGDKFTPESRIIFNGQELETQFGGTQRLTAKVSAALIASEGPRQLIVRTIDGSMFSNVIMFTVQAAPAPQWTYVGYVARKRFNNDSAMLQSKIDKQKYETVRLGETLENRFKVTEITARQIVFEDTSLKLRHTIAFYSEANANAAAGSGGTRGSSSQPQQQTIDMNGFPNNTVFQQYNPGQYPQVNPNQYPQVNPIPLNPNPNTKSKQDYEDDDDN